MISGPIRPFETEVEAADGASCYGECVPISRGADFATYRTTCRGRYLLLKAPVAPTAERMALLRREFEIGSSLSHPGIVHFIALKETTPVGPAIEMEYITGSTLAGKLKKGTSAKEGRRIFLEILDAVEYLHKKGIVHNDIKPENILISDTGATVKLIDFSLAESDEWYLTHHLSGTDGASAPEVMDCNPEAATDMRNDIYSLGKILGRITPQKRYASVIRRCTRNNPEDRYESVVRLREAFLLAGRIPSLAAGITAAIIIAGIAASALYPASEGSIPPQSPEEPVQAIASVPDTERVIIVAADSSVTPATPEKEKAVAVKPEPEKTVVAKTEQKQETQVQFREVDLGLSALWASANLGAQEPQNCGDYYSWGETCTKPLYSPQSYKFAVIEDADTAADRKKIPYSKYTLSDGKITLDEEDDAAAVRLGNGWRIPTRREWTELISNCRWEWKEKDGITGYLVTSRIEGYKDSSIFLPAAGIIFSGDSTASAIGERGRYWSSNIKKVYSAYGMIFDDEELKTFSCYKYLGLSIRPVRDRK